MFTLWIWPEQLPLVVLVWVVVAVPIHAQEILPLPLTGPAYELTEEAYQAYKKRNYSEAIAKTREALRQRPDAESPKRLLVLSLATSGQLKAAEKTASGFIAAGDSDKELRTMRNRIRAQLTAKKRPTRSTQAAQTVPRPLPNPAYQAADRAYVALAKGNSEIASSQARIAVHHAPANPDYRRLLVSALLASGQPEAAEQEASAALIRWPRNTDLYALRGYARQRLNKPESALQDFTTALNDLNLKPAQVHNLRMALADAAMAAGHPEQALAALSAEADPHSFEISSRRGFALLKLNRREAALTAFALAAKRADNAADRAQMRAAEIGILMDLGRTAEAREQFTMAYVAGSLRHMSARDLAYLASRLGEDQTALELYLKAQQAGDLRGAGLLDAAYTAKRLARNAPAIELLKAAIDSSKAGTFILKPQRLFEVRREVSDLSRSWGGFTTLSYGPVGIMSTPTLSTPVTSSGGDVLQAGTELYWRPPIVGYRNGRTFELFGRAFETLAYNGNQGSGAVTGAPTLQATVGARWKPFSDYNLVFEIGRLIKMGDQSRNDWLLRAAFSTGRGIDLRLDHPSWWMWNLYSEIVRYPVMSETVANFEVRLGRSFRHADVTNRMVITPFFAVGGGYDNLIGVPWALGAGPGINLRFWFREDNYRAPMSYLDFSVQYRLKLAGDDRAEGLFASFTLAF
jgi:regulator of sirC expression with transglutaminase-like and TPR domain